jgi:hypothetical protein
MRRWMAVAVVVALCVIPAYAQTGNNLGNQQQTAQILQNLRANPQIIQELEQMRAEIRANGWTFEVGVNPAMQYDLNQLCGRHEELLPPEVLEREYGLREATAQGKGGGKPKPTPTPTPTPPPSGSSYIGIFTPPKDQGNCGSCWAFGTIDEAETAILKAGGAPNGSVNGNGSINDSGSTPDLSEQYVLSCNTYGYSCNGGNDALSFLVGSPGAMDEHCFPYKASKVACSYCASPAWYPLSSWGYVQGGSDTTIPSVDAIKAAIQHYGAVTAYVYADNTFQAYTGGVYNNTKRYRYTNHQIQLVGWDDAKGAWLLKNSWGTNGWGIGGYMWITYSSCRVGEGAAWATY